MNLSFVKNVEIGCGIDFRRDSLCQQAKTEKVYGGVSRILGENAVNTDIVTIFIDIICTVWEGMIGAYLFRTYATKLIPWKKMFYGYAFLSCLRKH